MSFKSCLTDYEITKIELFDAYVLRGGYDALCQILELEIAGKGVFRYFDVPEEVWYELRKADSLIGYVRKRISGFFAVQKRLDNTAF